MPNEMTAAEAAEILDGLKEAHDDLSAWNASMHTRGMRAIFRAENILRAIAAGEYKPVVHGQWLNFYGDFATAECSECDECYEVSPDDEPREEYFSAFKQCYKHCPSCGARMAGKDDSHEAD